MATQRPVPQDPPSTRETVSAGYTGADKYKIEGYVYPSDLMSPEFGGNYAIFYINVNVDSKLLKENGGTAEITDDKSYTRERGALVAENLGVGALVTGAVGSLAAQGFIAGAAGASGAATSDKGRLSGGLKGAGAFAAPGAIGLGAAATLAGSTNRSQKRLKTSIALHIPNQLSIRYGTQWSEDDTSTALMLPLLGEAALKALGNLGIRDISGAGVQGKKLVEGAAALGLAKGPNAGMVSAATGLAFNPRKEQIFKGVDFRTFQFDYQFFPRSAAESRNVLNIIRMFKLHMHPEFKDSNKFLYIYPSEFDISYFSNGSENKAIHRHTSCVLTELSVNYTPNGQFTAFPDGTPTQINMQLSFRELAQLNKDLIQGGM